MSAVLVAWLTQPINYAAGVALYEQLGGRAIYQRLFAGGETSYSRQVLVRELTALATVPVQVPTPPAAPAPKPGPVATLAAPEATQTHTDSLYLPPVRDQLRALRDERSHLHAQLTAPRLSQKDRGKHAFRILAIGEQVLQLLSVEAHVLAHGTLPAGPVQLPDVEDREELHRRLNNLVAKRSKLRKNPARAVELPGVEADIELIREKLTPHSRV